MDLSELVEIATANAERSRVEIVALEKADIPKEAVGGLTQLITELVDNAIAFSGPEDVVSITGVFDREDYVIAISDNGVGIPETLRAALNEVLASTGPAAPDVKASLGIAMVARLAGRHGIHVRLVPSVPGTTARVTLPSALLTGTVTVDEPAIETEHSMQAPYRSGHVVAMTESARKEAEAFLEKVFGPLRGEATSRQPAETKSNGNGHLTAGHPQHEVSSLQTRVPGENFAVTEDDPSIASGEGAIDIRLNLSKYDEGRRQASDVEGDEDGHSDA